MKKTEIVRVRIDSPTYSACVRHCQNTGESLSAFLRKSLKAAIQNGADTGETVLRESGAAHGLDQTRAEDLATILIAHYLSLTGHWNERTPAKHREVSRLVGELLRAIHDCDRAELKDQCPSTHRQPLRRGRTLGR
jgi:hypothetical protein